MPEREDGAAARLALQLLGEKEMHDEEKDLARVDRERLTEGSLTASQNKLLRAIRGLDYQGQWQALTQALMVGTNEEIANDVARVVDAAFEWSQECEQEPFEHDPLNGSSDDQG